MVLAEFLMFGCLVLGFTVGYGIGEYMQDRVWRGWFDQHTQELMKMRGGRGGRSIR